MKSSYKINLTRKEQFYAINSTAIASASFKYASLRVALRHNGFPYVRQYQEGRTKLKFSGLQFVE